MGEVGKMSLCEHAEALRLLLAMGIVSKSEVISWADEMIMAESSPPGWLLDLSLAANAEESQIDQLIRDAPCSSHRLRAAYLAMAGFADVFNAEEVDVIQAAEMLDRWAASAMIDDEDARVAMLPKWLADGLEYYGSRHDVLIAIQRCIEHFEQK